VKVKHQSRINVTLVEYNHLLLTFCSHEFQLDITDTESTNQMRTLLPTRISQELFDFRKFVLLVSKMT